MAQHCRSDIIASFLGQESIGGFSGSENKDYGLSLALDKTGDFLVFESTIQHMYKNHVYLNL